MKIPSQLSNSKKILTGAIFILFFFFLTFSFSLVVIRQDVIKICLAARKIYRTNCLDSLILLVKSNNSSFRLKNSAVWTLGQLAEKKALPFLYQVNQSLPEQKKCDYDNYLCQYEVKKAIKWCQKGNVTSWMYKNRDEW